MVKIRAYNKRGLEILWSKVRVDYSTKEAALNSIYKTYGKEQWDAKCEQFNFYNYV
jgi:hypothetical protein